MFTIDNNVWSTYKGTKVGILVMKDIARSCSLQESEISAGFEEIQRRYGDFDRKELKSLYPIDAYTTYYKKFGCSYPVLSQLESILKGKKSLNMQSGLLQTMFLSEIESMLLTAGHDLSKLQLPLKLQIASGSENYRSISGKDVTSAQNDLMICDSTGVISSIMRGPDFNSRLTDLTTEVLFTVYAPPAIDTDYILTDLQKIESRVKSFSPDSTTEVLQVFTE